MYPPPEQDWRIRAARSPKHGRLRGIKRNMTEFTELGLSPTTLQAVAETGYTTATPIQAQAIPIALAGQDVLGIAQTGTGKTAAFTLPMIDRLAAGRAKARMPRALVIAPTRELADQVAASFERYAKGTKLSWALLIGGVSFGDQEKKLDRGVDVLIATPGRLLDHFERGKLLMTGVQIMVVDEADRMLDMGFIPDIERIFKLTPPKKQTLFFSATMPPEITRLTKQFLRDPIRIEAARPATTNANITQHLVRIPVSEAKGKRMALRELIGADDVKNGIIFCNRKTEVDIVAKSLKVHGLDAAPIHGDLDQSMRTKTLADFRSGALRLLVASDVAARGLDIPDVSHVFNYDVPHHADDYVHRIGRTGRAGKSGKAYMIITPSDSKQLDKVIKLIGENPVEVTLDLDWAKAREGDGEGRGRSSSRREGSRGSSRDKDRRPRPIAPSKLPPAAMTPIEAYVPPPQAERAAAPESADAPAAAHENADRPARSRSRGGRSRGGSAEPRREAPPAVEQATRADIIERSRPPENRDRPERQDRAESPAQQRSDGRRGSPERGSDRGGDRNRGREEREDRADRDVVGFGSDMPAFLMAAPKRPTKA
jgi:superfamily II DNA/RNA helicase